MAKSGYLAWPSSDEWAWALVLYAKIFDYSPRRYVFELQINRNEEKLRYQDTTMVTTGIYR